MRSWARVVSGRGGRVWARWSRVSENAKWSHHLVAVSLNEQNLGTKRKYASYIPRKNQGKYLALWIIVFWFVAIWVYKSIDAEHQQRIDEGLVSMCDQRARMLQDQFSVSVNHVHALAVLVSTFHYYKNPSVIDQVCTLFLFTVFYMFLSYGFSLYNWSLYLQDNLRYISYNLGCFFL